MRTAGDVEAAVEPLLDRCIGEEHTRRPTSFCYARKPVAEIRGPGGSQMLVQCFKSVVKVLCNCSVLVCAAVSLLGSVAEARVTRIEITSREVVADGMSFGHTGPYEKLRGTVYFEVEPDDPHNSVVFDLDKAPRNKDGRVEFSADFFILKPVDMKKGNGGLFFEAENAGNKNSLRLMNDTP